jgi:hypothetical protein
MNYAKFTTSIESLREAYGDRAYPDARVRKIWDWARRANEALFIQSVDNAIGDCERAPMLSKLKEVYAELRSKNPKADKVSCNYCDGNGWICDSQPLPTAYACNCAAGERIPLEFARWQGPWVRIVPTPAELLRPIKQDKFKEKLNEIFTGVDAVEVSDV